MQACAQPHASAATHAKANDVELAMAQLMRFSNQVQKQVLDQLAAKQLLRSTPVSSSDRDLNLWAEAVYTHLTRVVGSSDGDMGGPGVIKRALAADGSWGAVSKFMEHSRLKDRPVRDRQRAYSTIAELVVEHARYVSRKSGAPLGPKLVANCAHNVSGIFENAFPGYLEAGLAQMVVR